MILKRHAASLCLGILFFFTCRAFAQAPNIASYQQMVFAPGVDVVAGSPVFTNTYQASAAVCNQPAPVIPPTVTNPTQLIFDDVANPGPPQRVCIVTLATALLPALPNQSGYLSTLTQTDNLGQASARSAASNPFSVQRPPVSPAHVQLK